MKNIPIDFHALINACMIEKKNTIYVLKGFGDIAFDTFKIESLYNVNINDVIETDLIDQKAILETSFPKFNTGKSFILTYEDFVLGVDTLKPFIKTYDYNLVIISNNLFHNYYPAPTLKNNDLLKKRIEANNGNLTTLFYNDYSIINDTLFLEYSGFDDDLPIKNKSLFDVEKFSFEIEDDNEVEGLNFGMSEETYIELLHNALNSHNKDVIITIDSTELLSYQKNLLDILNHLGYKIRVIKRYLPRIEDPRVPEYEAILKRKNDDYTFRKIKFYKNPGFSKETIEVSQSEVISALTLNALYASKDDFYNDVFVTAPTGSGKSILFQIPAIYLAENYDLFTIVITPLIGLMNDQVDNIQTMTNKAATINSDYTPEEKEKIRRKIHNNEVSILYISPETLLSNNPITNLIGDRKIGLLVIDESHIVSTWGKSFRPDYWFLGDYISYLRSKMEYKFPIATFSATITYGGNDDMHGDIIDSLKMKTGDYEFIAPMRRDDISFDITMYKKENDYRAEKDERTIQSLNQLVKTGRKTIAYFPYTIHVNEMLNKIKGHNKVSRYHGQLHKDEKNSSMNDFKRGTTSLMLATKAFGMGIDIDDIETVYHYAPTGNLSDYVQEIGRAARKEEIKGIAKVDFFENDYSYMKQLFGMSSIKNYQIVETLRKLKDIYIKEKRRNFTVSPDEFSFIFPGHMTLDNVDTSFKTIMLMIQKDFERNPRINFKPIVFKPRSMFTQGYFMIKEPELEKLSRTKFYKYFTPYSTADEMASKFFSITERKYIDRKTFEMKTIKSNLKTTVRYEGDIFTLDFKNMWEDEFSDISFGQFKYFFYTGQLPNFELSKDFLPEYLLEINSKENFEEVIEKLESILRYVVNEFSKPDIDRTQMKIEDIAEILAKNDYITLSNYESIIAAQNFVGLINMYKSGSSFNSQLVFKRNNTTERYTITSINLLKKRVRSMLSDIRSKFQNVQGFNRKVFLLNPQKVEKVKTSKELFIAQIFEMFRLATYQVVSGERPEYFIRINSITQIDRILNNEKYKSEMVALVRDRHYESIEIMNHFFTELSDDKERWDFIEEYFVGIEE